jgi:hypothetical protein
MAYRGLVRAKVPCFHGGTYYSAGAVFEVACCLHLEDPYEPVRLAGHEPVSLHGPEHREVSKPIYEPIARTVEDLHVLNRGES